MRATRHGLDPRAAVKSQTKEGGCLQLRRNKAILLLSLLLTGLTIVNCAKQPTAPLTGSALISRVDAILDKPAATEADVAFLRRLSQDQFNEIWRYYGEHPRAVRSDSMEVADIPEVPSGSFGAAATNGYSVEQIECKWGPFAGFWGYRASVAFHTAACGGDTDDHFYQYQTIPNAYAERGRLIAVSVDPRVLVAFGAFGWKLSARVYDNNYVLTCVGGAASTVSGCPTPTGTTTWPCARRSHRPPIVKYARNAS